ncbi:MFS transporter [Paenibacillus glycanilyticus]|uniref:MFS transporter n=1 Tax=Paenibacillus glycanilyticus TaxID=126569 RepID=UPI003EBADD98
MEPSTRSQRLLFMTVTLMFWIAMYTYVPTLSPYLSSRGLSLDLIGVVLGSYGFVQLLIRFPLGMLSDRYGKRKPFILLGMLAASVSCLLFIIPGSWLWPLAGRAMAGLCASTWVAFTVMYANYFAAEDATKAMGNISVMTVSGQMIGMLLSGWMSEGFGADAPFVLGAVIGGIGLLLALVIHEPAKPLHERSGISFSKIQSVIRTKLLLQVALLSLLAHCVLFITMFGFTPLKAEDMGGSGLELTLLVFAFMAPHALASMFTARWFAPRFGNWTTIGAGFILSAVCTVSICYVHSIWILMLTQVINGFAQGLHIPLLLGLAIRDVDPPGRATAMGLYQAVYAAGMFAGPFLAGWLNESWGLNSGFALGGMFGLIAAALCLVYYRSDRKLIKSIND